MSERMAGKVAVVTGAASRIGSVSAERLASEGATVVILDRIEASDTVTKLVGLGLKASSTVVDVTDPDQIGRATDQVAHESGGADILINNAGIKRVQPRSTASIEVDLEIR